MTCVLFVQCQLGPCAFETAVQLGAKRVFFFSPSVTAPSSSSSLSILYSIRHIQTRDFTEKVSNLYPQHVWYAPNQSKYLGRNMINIDLDFSAAEERRLGVTARRVPSANGRLQDVDWSGHWNTETMNLKPYLDAQLATSVTAEKWPGEARRHHWAMSRACVRMTVT